MNEKFSKEALETIIRNNLSCYYDKPLSNDLIKVISQQIVESIEFILNSSNNAKS